MSWRRKLEHRDLLSVSSDEAAQAGMQVIDSLQHREPAVQVAGAAMAFVALMSRAEMTPADAFAIGDRMLRREGSKNTEMKALKAYLAEEVFNNL